MPIYEYKCEKCGEIFEVLIIGERKATCPKCSSKKLRKLVSGFAPISSGNNAKPCGRRGRSPSCGGCCCGSC